MEYHAEKGLGRVIKLRGEVLVAFSQEQISYSSLNDLLENSKFSKDVRKKPSAFSVTK